MIIVTTPELSAEAWSKLGFVPCFPSILPKAGCTSAAVIQTGDEQRLLLFASKDELASYSEQTVFGYFKDAMHVVLERVLSYE